MIYAKVETQKQQDELKAALRNAKKSHIYRRLLCIQLSSEGKKVNELSSMFHLCELTIRNYIQTYNESGLAKLIPKPKPGRKAKLSLTKEQWEEILHQSPSKRQTRLLLIQLDIRIACRVCLQISRRFSDTFRNLATIATS